MELLVLPGNHPDTRAWAERVARALGSRFARSEVHAYLHWQSGREHIDFEVELARLPPLAPSTMLLGKSAGAVLALLGIDRGLFAPERLVLVGLPLRFARAVSIDLEGPCARLSTPALFVQESADPAAAFTDVEPLARLAARASAAEVPGDDHRYDDVDALTRQIDQWAKISHA